MKIVMAGPSGSGKTTLARQIAIQLGMEFIENSAGLIMLPEDKEKLWHRYRYKGEWGQVGVINKSHEQPTFGLEFQKAILRARTKLLIKHRHVVLDRSPIDALVFYLNQCVHNYTQEETDAFIEDVAFQLFSSGVTHIVRIPLQNPKREIENDNSRCHNWYFQQKVDTLFDLAINLVKGCLHGDFLSLMQSVPNQDIPVYQVETWDWNARVSGVMGFINKH